MRVDVQQSIPATGVQQRDIVPQGKRSEAPARTPATDESEINKSYPAVGQLPQRSVSFRVSENNQVYFVVTDEESGKVVREVPPEEVRRAGAQISNFLEKQAAPRNTVSVDT